VQNFNRRYPVTKAATPNQKPRFMITQPAWSTQPILQPTTEHYPKTVPPTSHPLNQCVIHVHIDFHANHGGSSGHCQCVGLKVDNDITEEYVSSISRMTRLQGTWPILKNQSTFFPQSLQNLFRHDSINLKMEAAHYSEIRVYTYNPTDC